jgi:hypothetical protein
MTLGRARASARPGAGDNELEELRYAVRPLSGPALARSGPYRCSSNKRILYLSTTVSVGPSGDCAHAKLMRGPAKRLATTNSKPVWSRGRE